MKPKFFIIAAVLGMGLVASSGFVQPLSASDFTEQFLKIANKERQRAQWNGSLEMTLQLLINPEFREAWDVSEEQYRQIEDIRNGKVPVTSPEYLTIEVEKKEQLDGLRGAELHAKTLEFQEKLSPLKEEFIAKTMDNLLTAEQKRKIREFQFATMSEDRFISFHAFEAFDLTDAQKLELAAIKKEFEPEFERQLEEFVDHEDPDLQLWTKMQIEFRKQGGGVNDPLTGAQRDAIRAKLLAEDPEFKKMHEKNVAQKELLASQFKTVMFDVLTDEQWNRLQKLLDNPPDYIKAWRKKVYGVEDAVKKNDTGQPGPNSWRPGDPIPEQYRQERNERQGSFPRTESE
jgi:hypothetical protein